MTTFSNYHKDTDANFTSLSAVEILAIMAQYVKSRRSSKINSIQHDGKTWAIDFESERKSAFWRSRSFSFYFTCEQSGEVMRISDHWSASNYPKSEKLNCQMIRSCWWTIEGASVGFRLPGEKYESRLMGGICRIEDFKIRQYQEEMA